MISSKASLYPVYYFQVRFLGSFLLLLLLSLFLSTTNGPRLNQCGFDSTDYASVFHSTGEEVCCRKRICPPGHYAEPCSSVNPESTTCRPCPPGTFQPIPNQLGTKCIKKKLCDGLCTRYNHRGTSTENAECECKQGCYWNEESSTCKKNKLCPPGYEIDDKGGCMECSPGTFSDTYDNLEKCRPHTKCEKFNRCVRIPGNATDDNVCCDQQQAGIVSASHIENRYLHLHVLMVLHVVFLTIAAGNFLLLRRGTAKDHTPIRRSEFLHPRVSQDEKTEHMTDFKAWPNTDEVLLPVTNNIDDSSECTTTIPIAIPERLEKILWQFNFVHMLGFDEGSVQVYVLRKHLGKHTELAVKEMLKSLVKAHGMDCDVIVSATSKGISSMCGKKPSRPGAKIVIEGKDEDRFGSLGGYFRTSAVDSPVYVITNEHVANKDDDVRVIQSCDAGTVDTCTEVHYGTCRWAIKTGSTPSRYVDIAAIVVPTLGWRPGIKDGPGESIFRENIDNVIGELVFKYGAQTGLTYGRVKDVERSTDEEGNELMFVIVDGIIGTFCAGGDSGSFVRLEDGHELLAMVMGGELKYKKALNGDYPNASVCYLLSVGLLELEKMTQLKWIPVDEAHIQCLLKDHE